MGGRLARTRLPSLVLRAAGSRSLPTAWSHLCLPVPRVAGCGPGRPRTTLFLSLREAFLFCPRATAVSLGRRIERRPPTRLRVRPSWPERRAEPRCPLRFAQGQRLHPPLRPLGTRTLRRHRPPPAGRLWPPPPRRVEFLLCSFPFARPHGFSRTSEWWAGGLPSAPRVKRLLLRRPRGPQRAPRRRETLALSAAKGTARDPAARRTAGSRPQEPRAAASGGEQGPNTASPEGQTERPHAVEQEPVSPRDERYQRGKTETGLTQ